MNLSLFPLLNLHSKITINTVYLIVHVDQYLAGQSWVGIPPGSQIMSLSHASNLMNFINLSMLLFLVPHSDNDGDDNGDDDDDFGGGVDNEMFLGDADAPDTIEPMGMEKKAYKKAYNVVM